MPVFSAAMTGGTVARDEDHEGRSRLAQALPPVPALMKAHCLPRHIIKRWVGVGPLLGGGAGFDRPRPRDSRTGRLDDRAGVLESREKDSVSSFAIAPRMLFSACRV